MPKTKLKYDISFKGPEKDVFLNPYYNLVKKCLGSCGDHVICEDHGKGKFGTPLTLFSNGGDFVSHIIYKINGLKVSCQIFSINKKSKLYLLVAGFNDFSLGKYQEDFEERLDSLSKSLENKG